MSKLQYQKGTYFASIPPGIIKYLEAQKGSEIDFYINKKNGQVEVKVKEGEK